MLAIIEPDAAEPAGATNPSVSCVSAMQLGTKVVSQAVLLTWVRGLEQTKRFFAMLDAIATPALTT